jgi:hypothetical protein
MKVSREDEAESLEESYRLLAMDEEREGEAKAWDQATIADAAD